MHGMPIVSTLMFLYYQQFHVEAMLTNLYIVSSFYTTVIKKQVIVYLGQLRKLRLKLLCGLVLLNFLSIKIFLCLWANLVVHPQRNSLWNLHPFIYRSMPTMKRWLNCSDLKVQVYICPYYTSTELIIFGLIQRINSRCILSCKCIE